MLDHSLFNLLAIRTCILALRYTPVLEAALLIACLFFSRNSNHPLLSQITIYVLVGLLTLEATYYLLFYRRHKDRLSESRAQHPAPLTPSARRALFERCVANVPDWDRYLRLWFLLGSNSTNSSSPGNDLDRIKRDNVREFLLWGFFDGTDSASEEEETELQGYLARVESLSGRKFAPGRGSANPLRLTIDEVITCYRSVVWYAIVAFIDLVTYLSLSVWHGFDHYKPAPTTFTQHSCSSAPASVSVFPPRLHLQTLKSPSSSIGYWYRPHVSRTKLPILFIHGIGVGLWPYTKFLGELDADNEIGIIALEIMPMSTRLTHPPLAQADFLREVGQIWSAHGQDWERFVLVSHSYGSVLSTHILRSADLGPRVRGLVLIDPVSILLHLPDVAYNFTRRAPKTANEWQLWYFASMDMGVAEGLGRHFFWRENIIWREELVRLDCKEKEEEVGDHNAQRRRLRNGKQLRSDKGRKVAVCLSGRDLIVDTRTVARYLASDVDFADLRRQGGNEVDDMFGNETTCTVGSRLNPALEIMWFPQLDHAQVFDSAKDRARVVEKIRRFCLEAVGDEEEVALN
ncbi:hypothetical protein B0H66DRAFT_514066 [Apodospora peruviana]|uniref:AB hydrolase-1 domain-containing protein n=1 Tax=Apodospora peruviana TaxID=516989 RepID=A0AAE0M769_9PEZI|nr:hypothetical protein B0H66DRAFT_514066 [Apodospora peruviana]